MRLTALLVLFFTANLYARVDVIPAPNDVSQKQGFFKIDETVSLVYSPELEDYAKNLNKELSPVLGFSLLEGTKAKSDKKIALHLNKKLKSLGEEGYRLSVGEFVLIEAKSPAGIFYGVQTLKQLMPVEVFSGVSNGKTVWKIPHVEIVDSPRFKWRGLHLDVARHFMSVEYVKKTLDLMAIYKLNKFHWHLTDDQGWRVEIKKYPKLTEVGAWRDETRINRYASKPEFDQSRYGGYYTQEQIREVVQYAKERFIDVVPEIEMPGHCSAAIAAYPELSCKKEAIDVPGNWGVFKDVYCVGSDKAYKFNCDVLSEIFELFPSEYIHIGGDEVPTDSWKDCQVCQSLKTRKGIKDDKGLQTYFMKRIVSFIKRHKRKAIGWDENLEADGSLSNIMCWRDGDYGKQALEKGYNVVMANRFYCYLNYSQTHPAYGDFGGYRYVPVERVYDYEPVPEGVSLRSQKHVMGVQGCAWSEWMRDSKRAEYMIWPRACAIAEIGWADKDNKNYISFRNRFVKHEKILDLLDVNYCELSDYKLEKPHNSLRILSYNILYGGNPRESMRWHDKKMDLGYETKAGDRTDDIIKVMQKFNADIIFVQECTGWEENNNAMLNYYSQRLGMHGVISPGRNKFKVAILSKYPLANVHWLDDDVDFYHNMIFADAVLDSGRKVQVATQHFGWWGDPKWRSYNESEQAKSYEKQYESLIEILSNRTKPLIIGGDFNHFYEREYFGQKPLYSSITDLGFVDSVISQYGNYDKVISGMQKRSSYKGPIDFIFVSPEYKQQIINAGIDYSAENFKASDHLPIWVDLNLN